MAVVWAMRSDNSSFNARYSAAGLLAGFHLQSSASAQPLYEADANAIGGNRFNFDRAATLNRIMAYPGRGVFSSKPISILVRVQFGITGGANLGLFSLDGAAGFGANKFSVYAVNNGGASFDIRATVTQENGSAGINNVTLETFTPSTSVYYDLVWTWDGTTSANQFKYYRDGVSKYTGTSTQAWATSKDSKLTDFVTVGGVSGITATRQYMNECVVWDSVIDPTSVALTSGTGSLNGSSRTAFVDVASFDGSSNTSPGVGNVRSGTTWYLAGVQQTGTATIPSLANTKTGVAGDGGTGTYDGSDRWTDPGEANVLLNTQYKANSLTNNKTGTLQSTDPGEANVVDDVTYYINSVLKTGTLGSPENPISPATILAYGNILDSSGTAISGATVMMRRYVPTSSYQEEEGNIIAVTYEETTTDVNGYFELELVPGDYIFKAWKADTFSLMRKESGEPIIVTLEDAISVDVTDQIAP